MKEKHTGSFYMFLKKQKKKKNRADWILNIFLDERRAEDAGLLILKVNLKK